MKVSQEAFKCSQQSGSCGTIAAASFGGTLHLLLAALTKFGCGAQIAAAAKLWDGTGSMLFTSSAGIYAEDDGGSVNEDSPISAAGSGDRTDRYTCVRQSLN